MLKGPLVWVLVGYAARLHAGTTPKVLSHRIRLPEFLNFIYCRSLIEFAHYAFRDGGVGRDDTPLVWIYYLALYYPWWEIQLTLKRRLALLRDHNVLGTNAGSPQ